MGCMGSTKWLPTREPELHAWCIWRCADDTAGRRWRLSHDDAARLTSRMLQSWLICLCRGAKEQTLAGAVLLAAPDQWLPLAC